MNKNELNVIARIVLVGVGLYVVIQTFLTILPSIAVLPFAKDSGQPGYMIFIILGIYVIISAATVYFLFRCANSISAKIIGNEQVDDAQVSWLSVAFRLICVSAGVLFLYWSVPSLVSSVFMYMIYKNQQYAYVMYPRPDIARDIIMLALGIYFAFGAPGFVRWQVKRTLKQCSKFEEQKASWC
ncbi:MAG: hypothetical protein ABSH16_01885 [Sedimentisphaerales bacterium]